MSNTYQQLTPDEIACALSCVPANDRELWLRMGMALKTEQGEAGFTLWDKWSQTADNYQTKAAIDVWKSIKPGGGVTISTLFYEAIKCGYQAKNNAEFKASLNKSLLENKPAKEHLKTGSELERQERAKQARAAADAKEEWAGAIPLLPSPTYRHPYIMRKGIKPYGARLFGNFIVLPLYYQKQLVSLQYINKEGRKTFKVDGKKSGTYMVLGQLTQQVPTALLCEGWATGCSLYEATGLPVVIAWDAGNVPKVAKQLGDTFPATALKVCGDRDASGTGQKAAEKAAQVHGLGVWCVPQFTAKHHQQAKAQQLGTPTDFNDLHLLAGIEEVRHQIEQILCPVKMEEPTARELPLASDEVALINHLVSLSPLDYDRQKKEAAQALGVSISALNKSVADAKKKPKNQGDQAAGGAILFPEVEPWPASVNGNDVLNAALALLSRYVIADKETLRAAVLWATLSWFADNATVLPLAVITAPEKGCGKSTLLTAIGKLVRRPLSASNITPAALFRTVEAWKPTLMIDEADTFAKDNEELRGVINAGHTRETANIVRVVEVSGEHQPRAFSVYGPKALAGIGRLPDTIMSRSIELKMRRKLMGETSANLRHCERGASKGQFGVIAQQLARWAEDNGKAFADHTPDVGELYNRNADNWEPLLSLADLAGGDWPMWARAAANKLTDTTDEAPSFNEELLGDIKTAFEHLRIERITTTELLAELCKDEEAAWATYNRGRPLSARQLSKKLGEFGIKPNTIRFGTTTAKGYQQEQFTDAFTRYLA